MNDAHTTVTIASLSIELRRLRNDNNFLEYQVDELQGELAAAVTLSDTDTPRQVFATMRQELVSWSRSDWRELGRLIALYVCEL